MNRDLLNNASPQDVARGAMTVIDKLQLMQPHVQIASLASVFVLAAERWGIDPKDAFKVSSNIMNHADGRRPEFKAVRQYMEEEL